MTKAELCPVCNGSGKLSVVPQYESTANNRYDVTCHGCNGKGWVEVSDGCCCPPYPYYPYYPWYPYYTYPLGDDNWDSIEWTGDTITFSFTTSGDGATCGGDEED